METLSLLSFLSWRACTCHCQLSLCHYSSVAVSIIASVRHEYAAKGIRINAVSPGVIRTPGLEKYFEEQPKMAEQLRKVAPMQRLGEPAEIANAVAFLLSEKASFITGQLLSVDGGGAVRG